MEYLARFLIGGAAVSLFALAGDVLRPKSFAGLFGAAPSAALASLGLVILNHGAAYASQEAWAMACGAIALLCYSVLVCHVLMRRRLTALPATLVCLSAWLVIGFSLLIATGQFT